MDDQLKKLEEAIKVNAEKASKLISKFKVFKNNFERLRPCHEASLADIIHTVRDKCGGHYGFISSHASNSFALAVFLSGFIRRRYRYFPLFILIWASVVSYSRIYLGVHYPFDVIVGAIFGSLLGYLALSFFRPGFFKSISHS